MPHGDEVVEKEDAETGKGPGEKEGKHSIIAEKNSVVGVFLSFFFFRTQKIEEEKKKIFFHRPIPPFFNVLIVHHPSEHWHENRFRRRHRFWRPTEQCDRVFFSLQTAKRKRRRRRRRAMAINTSKAQSSSHLFTMPNRIPTSTPVPLRQMRITVDKTGKTNRLLHWP
jgi:hypothetical protein